MAFDLGVRFHAIAILNFGSRVRSALVVLSHEGVMMVQSDVLLRVYLVHAPVLLSHVRVELP